MFIILHVKAIPVIAVATNSPVYEMISNIQGSRHAAP